MCTDVMTNSSTCKLNINKKCRKQQILKYQIFSKQSLPKIPQFPLISWCGNFVEKHSFRIVSGDSPETLRKLMEAILHISSLNTGFID